MSGTDDGAFRLVFDRTFPLAERLARRITGDDAVSQEIAAEALTRLYARWWRLRGAGYVDAWVMRVTTNLAIGVVRGAQHLPLAPRASTAGALDDVVALRLALADALERLPRRQREVVALRYLSDLSEADVASTLGLSAGTVKTHLHRGLARLRGLLQVSDEADVEVRLADQR